MKTPEEQAEILSTMIDRLISLRRVIVLGGANPGASEVDGVMDSCAQTFALCYARKYGEEPRI